MEPKPLLFGRFSFQGYIKSYQEASRFAALDADTGKRVVIALASPWRFATLELARSVSHQHLAEVLEVARTPDGRGIPETLHLPMGSGLAVAELVPGRTLHQVLRDKPVGAIKAVAWILRLIEAVQALHARGAMHGAISPFSIIAEPEGRAIAPVLAALVAPAVAAYCPPERLKGGAPSQGDDVWALHATLYAALTGRAPFQGSTREALANAMQSGKPKPLKEFGLDEPVLTEILERGLTADKHKRVTDLGEFTKLLDGWERDPRALPPKRLTPSRVAARTLPDGIGGAESLLDIVVDPELLAFDEGSAVLVSTPQAAHLPPPDPSLITSAEAKTLSALSRELPPTLKGPQMPFAVPLPKRLSFNPFERKRRVWPLVACAALASGAFVYLAVGARTAPVTAVAAPVQPTPAPQPAAKIVQEKRASAAERDACVRSHFVEGALSPEEDLAFVCADGDFRDLSRNLFARASGAGAEVAPGSRQAVSRSELGWYELAATSIIRKSCCPGTAPVILPETTGWCEQLQTVVRRVADDSAKAGDLAPVARSFDKAVGCLYANRISKPYLYERPPAARNRAAFQQFLSRAAITQARR